MTASQGLFRDPMSQVFRSPSLHFHVGEVVTVSGMRVEIMEVGAEGFPRRINFRFDASLEDPSLVWITWQHQGFVPFTPPAPGEKVTLSPASLVEALTGQKP